MKEGTGCLYLTSGLAFSPLASCCKLARVAPPSLCRASRPGSLSTVSISSLDLLRHLVASCQQRGASWGPISSPHPPGIPTGREPDSPSQVHASPAKSALQSLAHLRSYGTPITMVTSLVLAPSSPWNTHSGRLVGSLMPSGFPCCQRRALKGVPHDPLFQTLLEPVSQRDGSYLSPLLCSTDI